MIDKLKENFINKNIPTKNTYSQNGEDGVLQHIFEHIGTTNKFCVEFGCLPKHKFSNTKNFIDKGWTSLNMDKDNKDDIIKNEFITAENIELLFENYNVPYEFDLLSIDIDGNDFWIWKAINKYSPRVVIIEFNRSIRKGASITIKYDPNYILNGNYYGASFEALKKLGIEKEYTLVYNVGQVNLIFIKEDIIGNHDFKVDYSTYDRYPQDMTKEWVII